MDPITQQVVLAAAGTSAAADATYVDDVFSTYLYDGTGASQTITNGIDLSGEGGMVWMKSRETQYFHRIFDTERGVTKELNPSGNDDETTTAQGLTHFLSNGFTIGTDTTINKSGSDNAFVSWTFRKAPGFFDVVTYTGNGTPKYQLKLLSLTVQSLPRQCLLLALATMSTKTEKIMWPTCLLMTTQGLERMKMSQLLSVEPMKVTAVHKKLI
jgi:hypothetical protein